MRFQNTQAPAFSIAAGSGANAAIRKLSTWPGSALAVGWAGRTGSWKTIPYQRTREVVIRGGDERCTAPRERMRVQFRSEAFNLLNHPNLGIPASSIGAAGVGVIGSVINPERQIQMALKLYF